MSAIPKKRKAWQYREEDYLSGEQFYNRVTGWYAGATDLAPQLFKEHRFLPFDEFYSLGGTDAKFHELQQNVEQQEHHDRQYLRNGQLQSLNMGRQRDPEKVICCAPSSRATCCNLSRKRLSLSRRRRI